MMKTILISILLCPVFCFSAERIPVFELMGRLSCPYCRTGFTAAGTLQEELLINRQITISWCQSFDDGIYREMLSYYGAEGVPYGIWDGTVVRMGAVGTDVYQTYRYYLTGYNERYREESPLRMDIKAYLNSNQSAGTVHVGVTPEEELDENYELTIVIYEEWADTSPYGYNIPIPHQGRNRPYKGPITFTGLERVEVTVDFSTLSSWNLDQLGAAAFVRNLDTKEILQGIATNGVRPQSSRTHNRPLSRPE